MYDLRGLIFSIPEFYDIENVVVLPGRLSQLFAALHDTPHIWLHWHNYVSEGRDWYTVPFRIVRPSRVTGPVDMDEIGHLSRVTDKVANGLGRQINLGVGHRSAWHV